MRTLKLVAIWLIYIAVCCAIVFGGKLIFDYILGPIPTVAIFLVGYLLVLYKIIPKFCPAPPQEPTEEKPENK